MPSSLAASTWVSPLLLMILLICRTNSDFACISSASGKPRSSNTLPLPAVLLGPFGILAPLQFAVFLFCFLQSLANQVQLAFCRRDPSLSLLLETVQDEDERIELDRINRPIRVPVIGIGGEFEDSRQVAVQRLLVVGTFTGLH